MGIGSIFGGSSKSESKPYKHSVRYLLGDNWEDIPHVTGVFPESARLYEQGMWSPDMQWGQNEYFNLLSDRYQSPDFLGVTDPATSAMHGRYDPSINNVGNINYNPIADKSRVNYFGINPGATFGSFGAANPMNALSSLLSGRVNTSALDPVADNAMRRMTENFNEQVMPGIRGGAVASGQYGGSRQGVAEGLATKGLNYGISDMLANMYNNAFNTAQQNQYGTANNLAGLGTGLASQDAENMLRAGMFNAGLNQFDAEKDLGAQQFNANLGFQNNEQQMQLANQMINNRLQGLNMLNAGMGMQDDVYNKYMQAIMQPNQYGWQNLNNYANIMYPGAQLGGTNKQTSSPGIVPSILGTMAGIGGLMSGFGLLGGGAGLSPTAIR